jgi:hypothetical protein
MVMHTGNAGHKQFVCAPITPFGASFDAAAMSAGEPGLPGCFLWQGKEYQVACVLDRWKTAGPCKHGSGEQYVRKHWFRLLTSDGTEMEIYFDRQPRTRQRRQRWWLASIIEPTSRSGPAVDSDPATHSDPATGFNRPTGSESDAASTSPTGL